MSQQPQYPALLYTVDPEHMHNLFNVESPLLGVLATFLSILLTVLLLAAWAVAIRDARRHGNAQPRPDWTTNIESPER